MILDMILDPIGAVLLAVFIYAAGFVLYQAYKIHQEQGEE